MPSVGNCFCDEIIPMLVARILATECIHLLPIARILFIEEAKVAAFDSRCAVHGVRYLRFFARFDVVAFFLLLVCVDVFSAVDARFAAVEEELDRWLRETRLLEGGSPAV